MPYPNVRHLPRLAAILLLLAGCGTIHKDEQKRALEAAVNGYGKAIRWGYFETAYGYLHPTKRGQVPEYLKNVRVTGYEVTQPPLRSEEGAASQMVRIDYLHNDVQRVRTLNDRQLWRYDPATETWWLHSGVPELR